ncbi:ATP-binding protein [Thiomicrospira microaerophila]|uniref:ATP-binding protein n=1 Tax=Thiomicrospira microaerophila TaxID=406020 RepID=UPI0005CA5B29|nr:ATP-binding protein [Thiomicrospira microaerophila]
MSEDLQKQPVEDAQPSVSQFEPLSPKHWIRFEQVGGLEALKRQARIKIIEPFKNPALFKKFNKTAGGGLLLYGPPGCGKTFFARAIAGECNAAFFNVSIHDILDMYLGNSEKNIQALFDTARAQRPAVIFIDEIDALGRKRELMRHSSLTTTINQFLAQLDGVESDNENLLVIGATNAPWDVDSAFRRPGRFDMTLFVPPPDQDSRQQILAGMLSELPIGQLDYAELAQLSAHFSGADIKGWVDQVSETVIESILETGQERLIEQADLVAQRSHLKPSTLEWLEAAKNVVEYANQSGVYDELADYLDQHPTTKKRKIGFF